MNRRIFTKNIGLLLSGITLTPASMIAERTVLNLNQRIYPLIWQFARQVGYGLLTNYLYEYISDYLSDDKTEFKKEIQTKSKILSSSGYNSPSRSKVLSKYPGKSVKTYKKEIKDDTIIYGVEHHNGGQLAIFHGMNFRSTISLSFPTILALSQAVEDFQKKENLSIINLQNYVIPTRQLTKSQNTGSIETGYRMPDKYETVYGKVAVYYSSNGGGVGDASVKIWQAESLIFYKSYQMKYN